MSVQKQFASLVQTAAQVRASDLYVMPGEDGYRVFCYTATGIQPLASLTLANGEALIRHIKFEARMDISETRRPQLGRWRYLLDQEQLYLRISSVGDFLNRESIVVRLIFAVDNQHIQLTSQSDVVAVGEAMTSGAGLILLAGQMGSGKTTTLHYLAYRYLTEKMVLTIEDPVEVVQPNFLQLQVNKAAQMDYPDLLKLALRHHPDVMIIGEIRDAQTAQIVVEAALSGHLVISTIHAMSHLGIWHRLRDFGVPTGTLRQVLAGLVYQKLILTDEGVAADLAVLTGDVLQERVAEWHAE
ncbi:competence protein ComG [Weissella confusa]|uniref:Competence protein ComG n=1 Tax=Weissella confusa TaxID=1583 RepID=A0AAJ2YXP2_WEICO|nr:competence type IV pilus ATPase ComGA [Weissella confusa]MBJ7695043.1 Flp pilus assembly complex ATPase component TadA [Weissella confusa]NBA10976.1 competence protein ComG [Weissella confusa]QBZ04306.1 competence protein ComG [Weissella confusa]